MMEAMTDQGGQLLLIAGYRHAGKSLLLRHLEDSGWTCVDNLPPRLAPDYLARPPSRDGGEKPRIAIALDLSRGALDAEPGDTGRALEALLARLRGAGWASHLVFLSAGESTLLERESSAGGKAAGPEALARRELERVSLAPVAATADLLIDSSWTSPQEERDRVLSLAGGCPPQSAALVDIGSFGYKFGAAPGDLVIDLRFLPNPYYVPELRHLCGKDPACSAYVLSREGVPELLDGLLAVAKVMAAAYGRQGRHRLRLRVGCTGGRHRSVAIAEELGRQVGAAGLERVVRHRELDG
jgi:UPF0042 nucleotide-binding protein